MPEKWTGDIVGKMHVNRITYDELAKKLGFTKAYVSMVFSGSRNPMGAKQKFSEVLDELIQQKQKTAWGQMI